MGLLSSNCHVFSGFVALLSLFSVCSLITYGFHSNLPKAADLLSPIAWLKMLRGLTQMPSFDPMSLVLDSKAVMGFNLSFFADEVCHVETCVDVHALCISLRYIYRHCCVTLSNTIPPHIIRSCCLSGADVQHTLINEYLAQIVSWIESGKLRVAEVTVFDMCDVAKAHQLIQSGMSVGKIVVRCGDEQETAVSLSADRTDEKREGDSKQAPSKRKKKNK